MAAFIQQAEQFAGLEGLELLDDLFVSQRTVEMADPIRRAKERIVRKGQFDLDI